MKRRSTNSAISPKKLFHFRIILVEIRNGFNAFVVIEQAVMLIGRVDVVTVQPKAHQDRFYPQNRLKQGHDGNTTPSPLRNRRFAKCLFHRLGCGLVFGRIGGRHNGKSAVVRAHFDLYRRRRNGFEMP